MKTNTREEIEKILYPTGKDDSDYYRIDKFGMKIKVDQILALIEKEKKEERERILTRFAHKQPEETTDDIIYELEKEE